MRILLATTNPGKLREIAAVFTALSSEAANEVAPRLDLIDLNALDRIIDEPTEDGETFEANAIGKALHYAEATGLWCLADDSGLEVDALGGAPGVLSARYAQVDGPRAVRDPANNAKLLRDLTGVPVQRRTARFVCAMALVRPDRREEPLVVRGTIEGRILLPEECEDPSQSHRGRGDNGFGYDPLFLVPELGRTTAQISAEHKNRISHRGQAARLMHEALRRLLVST